MKKYIIKEIFGPTIQGEGTYSGKAVVFVRFTGCNRWSGRAEDKAKSICSFCDTDFVGGDPYTPMQLVKALREKSEIEDIVISGGEPLLQVDENLLEVLEREGFKVHIETNGSMNREFLPFYTKHVTISPKQSREDTKLTICNDIKLLVPYISDAITIDNFNDFNAQNFYVQPVMNENYEDNVKLAIKLVKKYPKWKISLQTHKIMGVE